MNKRKRGGQTLFKNDIIRESERMAGYGLTEEQIAYVFGVSPITLGRWKKNKPEFELALKNGGALANEQVVKSLYQRAVGFEYDEITYEKIDIGALGLKFKKSEIETIKSCDAYKTRIITKKVIPDTTAQIYWLNNKMKDVWRNVQRIEHSGKIDGGVEKIIVNIVNTNNPKKESDALNSRIECNARIPA